MFIEHPLVGRVLVNEIEAIGSLGDDVGLGHLADDAQHGYPGRCLVDRRWLLPDVHLRDLPGALYVEGQFATSGTCPPTSLHEGLLSFPIPCPSVDQAGHRGDGGMIHQCPPHGPLHGAKDGPPVAEAHFSFGGMHVHVHLAGIEGQVEHDDGVAASGHQRAIGLADGVAQAAILNPAAVDEEGEVLAVAAMDRRRADEAADSWGWGCARCLLHLPGNLGDLLAHGDQLLGHFQAVEGDQHVHQVATADGLKDHAAIGDEGEAQVGTGHGVAGDQCSDVATFGGHSAQELEARWHVVEEILGGDDGAGRRSPALSVADRAFLQA